MSEGKKILVAEDEKPMAKALELKLNKAGFQTTVVYDGLAVLDLLSKQKFDLVLLDMMMPKAGGFKVLTEMKNRGDKTPVIVSSNLSLSEDTEKAKSLGAKDFFIKSETTLAEVIANIQKVLGA